MRRLIRLPREQRRELWPALWRLVWVRAMLSMRGLSATQQRLSAEPGILSTPDMPYDSMLWHRRAEALQRAGRYVPGARCLARSLALWGWMRRSGIMAQLRLGVRRGVVGVESHAWVEYAGECYGETADNAASYVPLSWPEDHD